MRASLVAVTAETRDAHDLACVIGAGASAVNPYLAIDQVRQLGLPVETGRFGAMMDVALVNHGPVTLVIDSR